MTGRPLRFLGLATLGWIALRIVLTWQQTGSLTEAIREAVPPVTATTADAAPPAAALIPTAEGLIPAKAAQVGAVRRAGMASGTAMPRAWATRPPSGATAGGGAVGDLPGGAPRLAVVPGTVIIGGAPTATASAPPPIGAAPGALQIALPASLTGAEGSRRRWSGSAWLIARGGTGIGGGADSPQLGGTQGGIRVDYAISHGFAATGRVAVPAAGAGRELSLGVAWRPAGIPLRFVAEQRFALDRGRGGPTLGVSGGLYRRLPGAFRLEGYAQGGAILRNGTEHYVDGIVRATRPVTALGAADLDLGLGAWGGAQRGVARLDLGPTMGVRLPIADRAVRLSIDWRQRVAGDARPGSGPALSVGSDF
ncbi:hypothetical protein [Sphingomonas sp.]|uniref:hypothetical protein n=1 Tax=Sphingomonas sp. TaxID=28214 RepID=UPI002CD22132|nr:hypothetical protein [Sphingomonas sp.]HWK35497.1 hypothetical protein [Sphingomonas sp.]